MSLLSCKYTFVMILISPFGINNHHCIGCLGWEQFHSFSYLVWTMTHVSFNLFSYELKWIIEFFISLLLKKVNYKEYKKRWNHRDSVNQYRDRVSNAELYGDLQRVSFKVRQKRLRFSGHAIHHPVILWKPVNGHRGRGARAP